MRTLRWVDTAELPEGNDTIYLAVTKPVAGDEGKREHATISGPAAKIKSMCLACGADRVLLFGARI